MNEQVVIFTGSVPGRVRRAFSHISSIAKVAWGVEGEYFFVWPGNDANSQICSLSRVYGLVVKTNTIEGTDDFKRTQQGRWLSVAEHQDRVADEEYEEEKKQLEKSNRKIFDSAPEEIARKSKEESLKRVTRSKKPSDDEFNNSLETLGVEGTAKKYEVEVSTVVNVWAGAVKGAGKILRNLSPEKRGTFRIKKKDGAKSKKPG